MPVPSCTAIACGASRDSANRRANTAAASSSLMHTFHSPLRGEQVPQGVRAMSSLKEILRQQVPIKQAELKVRNEAKLV